MRTFLPEGAVAHVRRATRRRSFTLPPWRAGQRAAELVLCLIAQHGRPGRVRPFAIRVELVSCCALGVVIQVDAERRWHVEHHAWRLLRLVLDLKGCPRPVARAVEVTIEEGRLGGRAWLIAMSSGPSGRPVGLRGPASGPAALHISAAWFSPAAGRSNDLVRFSLRPIDQVCKFVVCFKATMQEEVLFHTRKHWRPPRHYSLHVSPTTSILVAHPYICTLRGLSCSRVRCVLSWVEIVSTLRGPTHITRAQLGGRRDREVDRKSS